MKTVWFPTRKQLALTPFLSSALAILAPSLWRAVNAKYAYQAGVPGTYELSFLTTGQLITDSTLPVRDELVLKATVKDSFQYPALSGSVTF